ncbi:MAG: tetraacyldisaccharide 4'-kinase [Micavibrio sp.]
MIRKTPSFWYDTNAASSRHIATALSSLSAVYALGHLAHQKLTRAHKADIPVICIGNLTAGGSGKTPTALAVMDLVKNAALAKNPCFLSRGYGGILSGPVTVDKATHTARDVGDEPLLLAAKAPTIIAADRVAGARFAHAMGHDLIIMDDGLQNPALHKNLSLVVIDGATGFGNGLLLPAGPLRTPVWRGLKQADAVLLIGADHHNVLAQIPEGKPVLRATVEATLPAHPAGSYFAFCGIAHPDKFRRSLESSGLNIAGLDSYPDHHPYTAEDIDNLKKKAAAQNARLITTAKDAARLPSDGTFDILPIALHWDKDSSHQMSQLIQTAMSR